MRWRRSRLQSRDSVSFPRNHLQKWCERLRHKLVIPTSNSFIKDIHEAEDDQALQRVVNDAVGPRDLMEFISLDTSLRVSVINGLLSSDSWRCSSALLMPKPKAAFARGFVVTTNCIRRQRCQAFRISTSEHYIFHLQRILKLSDNIEDVLSPLLLSESLQSRSADVFFETSSILVRKVSQLHRLKDTVDNQRRSQARTQTEKEHATGASFRALA